MICKKETIQREQVIARYLARTLDAGAVEEFEGHYLGCDECFEELRVSERLAADLRASLSPNLSWKQKDVSRLLCKRRFRSVFCLPPHLNVPAR